MKTKMIYYAKDGMRFDDPVKCAEYERTLGTLPGTIGAFKRYIEPYKDCYVFGMLVVWHDNKPCSNTFTTINIDHVLEQYTDIDELPEEDRYIKYKIDNIIKAVNDLYKDDDPCDYNLFYSDTMDFSTTRWMSGISAALREKMTTAS